MFRLAFALYSIIATALAGAGIIVVLSVGYVAWQPMLIAAVLGAVLAVPSAWRIARKITRI